MKKIISLLLVTVSILSFSGMIVSAEYPYEDGYSQSNSDDDYFEYSDDNGYHYVIVGESGFRHAPDVYSEEGLKEAVEQGNPLRTDHAYLKDEAGVIKGFKTITFDKIKNTAEKIDMNIAVFIGGGYRSDRETEDFTALAGEKIFGKDADTNTVFLYLDFEGISPSYDFIDTFNDAYFYYSDKGENNRIDIIFEDMDKYLPASGQEPKAGDICDAIDVFLNDLVLFKNAGMENDLYYKNAATNMYRITIFGNVITSPIVYKYFVPFLLASIIVGIFFAMKFGSAVQRQYKFRESADAAEYVSGKNTRVTLSNDTFIKEYTTKTKIESSSHSGGHYHSSGSHHSSSRSSSHHGGGHHR